MAPMAELLRKLRLLEKAVPEDIRNDTNYSGIRIDETGRTVAPAKSAFTIGFPKTGTQADAVDTRLIQSPRFQLAMAEAEVTPAEYFDPAYLTKLQHRCSAGDAGYSTSRPDDNPRDCGNAGTLGWFFFLDGVPVCVGSYHVFCPEGDATPLESTAVFRCGLREPSGARGIPIGSLLQFDKANSSITRIFDCALIRISDVHLLTGEFAPIRCTDGSNLVRPYPMTLANESVIAGGESFYSVGQLTRTCATSSFQGVGSRKAEGQMLYEQLFFAKFTQEGDSGAVIVHEKSNSVVGLVWAIDSKYTIANPLYRKPWHCCGKRTVDGVTLPEFQTKPCA